MRAMIQVWQDGVCISDYDYEPDVNQMETLEDFINRIHDLDMGEGFTYKVQRVD